MKSDSATASERLYSGVYEECHNANRNEKYHGQEKWYPANGRLAGFHNSTIKCIVWLFWIQRNRRVIGIEYDLFVAPQIVDFNLIEVRVGVYFGDAGCVINGAAVIHNVRVQCPSLKFGQAFYKY